MKKTMTIAMILFLATGAPLYANDHAANDHATNAHGHESGGQPCEGFGPQAPRDIDSIAGENKLTFSMAPPASEMNLCNVHFHENAEHKSKDFSIFAGEGHAGYDSGYQCNMSRELSNAELNWHGEGVCKSAHGDLKPGDTIEVHWVYSTCDIVPGPTLGACLSKKCSNPELRVETQVFTLVAEGGLDFNKLRYAKDLPQDTGRPVEFLGSTTGPKYSEQTCSEYQVTWNVRPKCAKVNINSVGEWCKNNLFAEDHAHGVRKLVTNPKLLSEIK